MNRKLTSEFIYWLTHWTYKIYKVWCFILPSVLWRCWLGGRKGIRPVKTEWWGAGVVICPERGAELHMAQLMPLPLTISCFSIIQNSFYLSGTGSPGWSRTGPLNVCVWCFLLLLGRSYRWSQRYYVLGLSVRVWCAYMPDQAEASTA